MRHLRLLLFFVAGALFAQAPTASFHGNGAPSLPCGPAQLYQQDNTSPAALWFCVAPSNTSSTANWAQLGSSGSTNATSIQGNAVHTGTPTSGQIYAWNSTNSDFELTAQSGGGGNVTQAGTNQVFTGANGLEVGAGGVLSLPLNVSSALTTPLTPGGPSGTYGQGHFNWQFSNESFTNTLGTAIDTEMGLGYNICLHGTSCIGTEPAWFFGLENNYLGGGSSWVNEAYIQFQPTPNGASRPWFVQVDRSSGCITSGLCLLTDWEINSPPNVGVGFHDWSNNAVEWATINGNGLQMAGYATQPSDTYLNIIGQNGKFGEFAFTNGTTGYKGYSVSDSSTIWEFDLLGTNNWMQYNNNKTSLGGSAAYNGNATLSVQAGSGTNVAMSIGLNSSNTADLLRFYGNTGSQLGQVSSAGLLTLPNITATSAVIAANVTDSALTSGQCVQASTGGLLTTTGAACGSGGGGAVNSVANSDGTLTVTPTTGTVVASLNLSEENKWLVSGAASLSGVQYYGNMFTGGSGTTTFPFMLLDNGAVPVTSWSTGGTVIGINSASGFTGPIIDAHINGGASVLQFRADGSFISALAEINTHGNATFGVAGDVASTGNAVYASGAIATTGTLHFYHSGAGLSNISTSSNTDGTILFTNNATTGFNTLYVGAASSSFPAWHVNSAAWEALRGDGTVDVPVQASSFNPSGAPTNETGSSGSCNFVEPFQGIYYKKVVAVCSGLNGTTASFTFPIAFTNAPGTSVALTGGSTGLTVGSVSTTAITITGTGSSAGVVTIEGY